MATRTIPVLDLGRFESPNPAEAAAAARELDGICCEIGFVVISNHGVPEPVQTALYDAAHAFFDLPLDAKMTVRRPQHDQNRGYIPYGEETLARDAWRRHAPGLQGSLRRRARSTARTTAITRTNFPIRTSRPISGPLRCRRSNPS